MNRKASTFRLTQLSERGVTAKIRDGIAQAVADAYQLIDPASLYAPRTRVTRMHATPEPVRLFRSLLSAYALSGAEAAEWCGLSSHRPGDALYAALRSGDAIDSPEARAAREAVQALGFPLPGPRVSRTYRFRLTDDPEAMRRRHGANSEQYAAARLCSNSTTVAATYQMALSKLRRGRRGVLSRIDPKDFADGMRRAMTYRALACAIDDIATEAGVDAMDVARAFVAAHKRGAI